MGQLTAKLNNIEHLLSNEEEWGPDITTVQRELKAYERIYQEFVALNYSVLSYLNEKEGDADQATWFQPEADKCEQFITRIEEWIQAVLCSNEVTTEDSVSNIASTMVSNTSSAHVKEEANRAALLAHAAALTEKQAFKQKEAQHKAEREQLEISLEAEREQLEINTALAVLNSKYIRNVRQLGAT